MGQSDLLTQTTCGIGKHMFIGPIEQWNLLADSELALLQHSCEINGIKQFFNV